MATYYLKLGTTTLYTYNSFATAKNNADAFNETGSGQYYVSDSANERIYPKPKYTVKDPTSKVDTYDSFTDAFNAAKGHLGFIIVDSNNNQVYPTQAYYWTPDMANLYFSNTLSAAISNADAFRTMVFNNSYKVYDDNGNLLYPKNAYFVSTGRGSSTKYTNFADARAAVLADPTKKVYDPLGNVMYEVSQNLSNGETEINAKLLELTEKARRAEEIINSRILEE